MTLAVLLGTGVGLGLALIAAFAFPPRPTLAQAFAALHPPAPRLPSIAGPLIAAEPSGQLASLGRPVRAGAGPPRSAPAQGPRRPGYLRTRPGPATGRTSLDGDARISAAARVRCGGHPRRYRDRLAAAGVGVADLRWARRVRPRPRSGLGGRQTAHPAARGGLGNARHRRHLPRPGVPASSRPCATLPRKPTTGPPWRCGRPSKRRTCGAGHRGRRRSDSSVCASVCTTGVPLRSLLVQYRPAAVRTATSW